MNKRLLKLSAIIIATATAAVALNAQPGFMGRENGKGHEGPFGFHMEHGPKGDMGRHLLRMSEKLDLTDQQEVQILELSQDFRSKMEAHLASAKPLRDEMKALRESESFDENAIRDAIAKAQPVMTEGILLRAKYRSDLAKVLTTEQKEQIAKFREKLEDRFENRSGKHRGPGHRGGPEGRFSPEED
jgi:protein CpxP